MFQGPLIFHLANSLLTTAWAIISSKDSAVSLCSPSVIWPLTLMVNPGSVWPRRWHATIG